MTPRNEVIWIDLDEEPESRRRLIRESGRSQLPVARGSLDAVQGVLRVKDWLRVEEPRPGDDAVQLQPALFVPNHGRSIPEHPEVPTAPAIAL
jgi:putative hemolysin